MNSVKLQDTKSMDDFIFFYLKNKLSKHIPLRIALKRIKYLEIQLPQEVDNP